VAVNIPQKTEISTDKQQTKSLSSHNRRENESNRERDRDRRDHYSSQNSSSSSRYRDRDDYNPRYGDSRRRHSPPTSSRDRHHDSYDRNKGKILHSKYLKAIFEKVMLSITFSS
jgi:hypothetical protein